MKLIDYIKNLLPRERPQGDRVYLGYRQAGVFVNEDRAMTHAAVWACVRIISETIAALPWRAYRKTPAGRELLDGSMLDYILHVETNPEMSAMTWREAILSHALLWGNGYAEIERDGTGQAINLWPVSPDKVYPDRTEDGRLWYIVDGKPAVEYQNMYHLKGVGFDGLKGYSVVAYAARSIGLGIALDEMAAATFANGAIPAAVIRQKEGKTLSADGVKALLKVWNETFRGPANGSKVAYLDAGMDVQPLSVPMEDLQFLDSRKFQVSEIARWFRVPPHKLADLDRATFSNIEHQSLEFVTDTIVPWVRRLESEAQCKLIGPYNRVGRVYTKINLAGLLRGDMESRYRAYAVGRQWGWLSANDIRELEDMNRIPNGDEYLVPLNMLPAGQPRADMSQENNDIDDQYTKLAMMLEKRERIYAER